MSDMADFLMDFAILDGSQARAELTDIENKRKLVEGKLTETDAKAKMTWMRVAQVVNRSVHTIIGVLEMAGVSLSQVTRAAVMGITQISTLLAQLAAAEAVTPALMWKVGLTLAQMTMAIAAGAQAESTGQAVQGNISSVLSTIRGFAGGFYF